MTQCGMGEQFERDHWGTISVDTMVSQVRQQLTRQDQQQRTADAATMSRMRIYNDIKSDPETNEPASYITGIPDRQKRSAIARFRMGTLPLHIETGRYINTPLNERLCRNCSLEVTEDEYHFLFICDKYCVNRNNHIVIDREATVNENTRSIFADINRTRHLGQFIIEALTIRNQR